MKVIGSRLKTEKREVSFTKYTYNICHPLPQSVLVATSLEGFKTGFRKFINAFGEKG